MLIFFFLIHLLNHLSVKFFKAHDIPTFIVLIFSTGNMHEEALEMKYAEACSRHSREL